MRPPKVGVEKENAPVGGTGAEEKNVERIEDHHTTSHVNSNSCSKELTAWARQRKITKAAFAAQLGTNRVSVRMWFTGRAFPRDEYCDKLYAVTDLNCFSAANRAEARAEHERLIPPQVKKDRKAKYLANADLFRKRSRDSRRKRYEAERQFVTVEELAMLRADPRKRKNVCRECGEILRGIGPHLWPRHKLTVEQYKKKWGFRLLRAPRESTATPFCAS